jgi:glycosyltransferase involved in cell wall biosynthesis
MRILFLLIAYQNIKENSSMYTDLAQEFVTNGHEVSVAVADGPCKTKIGFEGNINVLRVNTLELFNSSFIIKGFANILLPYQVIGAIKKYIHDLRFDAIIIPTPPITYLNTIKKLKKKGNPKVYLILRDIFPQNAKDLKIIKNPFLFRYFRSQEKKLYSASDYIGCMSNGNISYLEQHNPEVPQSKLHLLMNWKNVAEYVEPDLTLKKRLGFENRFMALYGGNFGKPQQVEFILDLAKEIQNLKDVVFLLIGEGTEKKRIIDLVKKMKLKNVVIKDPLPRIQYQELVKICDIGLVNLNYRFTIPNIPSRTLSYWEAKIPILAAIDSNTDYNKILEQSGGGLWSITGDLPTYKQNFEKLYSNKLLRSSMGEKGYKYLTKNCTTSQAYKIIYEKLSS